MNLIYWIVAYELFRCKTRLFWFTLFWRHVLVECEVAVVQNMQLWLTIATVSKLHVVIYCLLLIIIIIIEIFVTCV